IGDMLFEAQFPPMSCGTTVEYYFEIESMSGQSYYGPLGAPETTFTASVANIQVEHLVDEGFAAGVPADWSATGLWHVTSACTVAGACQPQWAYYGLDGACDYDSGATSGELTSAP